MTSIIQMMNSAESRSSDVSVIDVSVTEGYVSVVSVGGSLYHAFVVSTTWLHARYETDHCAFVGFVGLAVRSSFAEFESLGAEKTAG